MFNRYFKMKQLFFICITLLFFTSCSVDDSNDYNGIDYNFEFIPIESVEIPESFVFDSIHQIRITYFKPTNCHDFYDFYYLANDNERTVAVINVVYDNSNCEPLEEQLVEKSFDFKATYNQTYIFKFWQGEDENGEDIYLTYEVPTVY